jgi:ankyrin repeat protein
MEHNDVELFFIILKGGDLHFVQHLVRNKPSLLYETDPTTDLKSTPLMIACLYGHLDIVRWLLYICGVPAETLDTRGHDAMWYACQEQRWKDKNGVREYLRSFIRR